MIIIGILAAIAIPNFLNQVGKSRETEFLGALGAINRAQQSYHFEKQTFASDINQLDFDLESKYIDQYIVVGDTLSSTIVLVNNDSEADATRGYSGGVFFSAGDYSTVICSSSSIEDQIDPPVSSNDCQGNNIIK